MDALSELSRKWPSPIVARTQIKIFTGGAVAVGTLANADSRGEGPSGRFTIGKKVCYPVASVIEWLERKANPVHERQTSASSRTTIPESHVGDLRRLASKP